MNISHFGICVSDMERAKRFYTEALGFAFGHSVEAGRPFDIVAEVPEMKLQATFLTRDGFTIELLYYQNPPALGPAERRPMHQLGITHMAVVVEDIDATADLIVKHGGRALPQTRASIPGNEFMFCTDPDGVRIELWRK